jgi:hypothetical protein
MSNKNLEIICKYFGSALNSCEELNDFDNFDHFDNLSSYKNYRLSLINEFMQEINKLIFCKYFYVENKRILYNNHIDIIKYNNINFYNNYVDNIKYYNINFNFYNNNNYHIYTCDKNKNIKGHINLKDSYYNYKYDIEDELIKYTNMLYIIKLYNKECDEIIKKKKNINYVNVYWFTN